MEPERASRTAEFMALFRAIESSGPAETRLFEDRFAHGFLTPALGFVAHLSTLPAIGAVIPWLIDRWWPGPRGAGIMRTRFIDDALRDALRDGFDQVVILGAGFDSRAYRIPGVDRARVFEVDHPATQRIKREQMQRMLGTLPAHVTFVPVDFNRQRLEDVMAAAGLRATGRTFFIWEGVTNYLTANAVDATFLYMSSAAGRGGRIVFTYIHRGILDGSARFAGAQESIVTVRRAGEPFTFGFDPSELRGYLAARALTLLEDVSAPEYRERYLRPLGRDMPVSEFYRAAVAQMDG